MEIPFYLINFPESASSIPSRQKNFVSQQNNFRETVKCVI